MPGTVNIATLECGNFFANIEKAEVVKDIADMVVTFEALTDLISTFKEVPYWLQYELDMIRRPLYQTDLALRGRPSPETIEWLKADGAFKANVFELFDKVGASVGWSWTCDCGKTGKFEQSEPSATAASIEHKHKTRR